MKVQIEKISRQQKTSKAGKPFTSVGIMLKGVWYNGFGGKWNEAWQVGDIVDIELIEANGYKNFDKPDPIKALEARVADLEAVVFPSGPKTKSAPISQPRQSQRPSSQHDERNPPPYDEQGFDDSDRDW